MPKITPAHVWLYRRLGGRIVNRATGGAPVLLVTANGRRTGKPRTVPLGHLRVSDTDDAVVAGTNGGLPTVPAWVLNLRANPDVTVELGRDSWPARAEFLEGDSWQEHWDRLVHTYPAYEDARRSAGREIPLILLRRVESPRDDRG